jgi:dTDP-4-amino-4,6-dideoxygalactose transaminase
LAAGVGPGKTLVTSPITFVASANAGLYAGGNVAFADIDEETVNMSPKALKIVLEKNPHTRAVVPVHFAGLPCDMPAIKTLADNAGALVIEDAAHALGAIYPDGSRVGCCANSLMTIFSFHPVKAIAAGEGGMITTNDERIYRKLLRLRSHGINKLDDQFLLPEQAYTGDILNPWYYEMQELGFHYRITDFQCALASSQLRKLDLFLQRRKDLARRYDAALEGVRHLRPTQQRWREKSAHHLYVLNINFRALGKSRASLMTELRDQGIGTQVHYIPVVMQPMYRNTLNDAAPLHGAFAYYERALSIPLHHGLTDDEQAYVIKVLRTLLK